MHRIAVLLKEQTFGRLAEPADVPPEHAAVAGDAHALGARLALQPGHVVHGVPAQTLADLKLKQNTKLLDARVRPTSFKVPKMLPQTYSNILK